MRSTPILLIPGINATPRAFQEQLETFWQFGPVTIADQRGASTMSDIAEQILASAPPTFILGGFSMGGYVALEIMRQAPERVVKLMLIDTRARPDSPEETANRRRNIALAQGGKFEQAVASTFPNAVHPDHVNDATLKAIHLGMARATGPATYIREQEATMSRPDSRPSLAAIKVPTLIIVGDKDAITPPDAAREMHQAIAGSELAVIKDAGHMALVEQPEQVNAVLRAFLAK
jgi:pimeloyl-ACP methyl ester carboxylesterase